MRRNWVPTAAAKQAALDRQLRHYDFKGSPMAFWDKVFGGHLAREMAQPIVPRELNMDTPMERLRSAMFQHSQDGEPLMQAVRRWRPDPANPGKSLDGSDLDAHPHEHRTRKLKEAEAALRVHDNLAISLLNPLIAEAEAEPHARQLHGTPLSSDARAEAGLLAQQYQGLSPREQAELGSLGRQAVERGDLQMGLAHKKAADVIHAHVPELDEALAARDPERLAGKAELDKLQRWRDTFLADEGRRHVRAGMADSVEQVGHSTWAQQHGYQADGSSGSYVQAVLSGE